MRIKSLALMSTILAGFALSGNALADAVASPEEEAITRELNRAQLENAQAVAAANESSGAWPEAIDEVVEDTGEAAAEVGDELDQTFGPETPITPEEVVGGVALSDLEDPVNELHSATVESLDGEVIGEVNDIAVDGDGMVDSITVEVGGTLGVGEVLVDLDAENFIYLPDRDVLVTRMTRSDIEAMAPLPPHS